MLGTFEVGFSWERCFDAAVGGLSQGHDAGKHGAILWGVGVGGDCGCGFGGMIFFFKDGVKLNKKVGLGDLYMGCLNINMIDYI